MMYNKRLQLIIFLFLNIACVNKIEHSFSVVEGRIDDPCLSKLNTEDCPEEFSPDDSDNPYGQEDTEVDLLEDNCDQIMRVRKIIPDLDSIAPQNTKPIVLTIGNGDETHLSVELYDEQGQVVEVEQEVDCYLHEADTEIHCTYLLEPVQELVPNVEYVVRVVGTEDHQEPGTEYRSWFTTSSNQQNLSNEMPAMEILSYIDREPTAVQTCDWPNAMKYELQATVAEEQSQNLSVLQVFEVHDINTGDENLVHSIILPKDYPAVWFRQVLTPGTEGPRCYRSEHRDVAGNKSSSTPIICWEE